MKQESDENRVKIAAELKRQEEEHQKRLKEGLGELQGTHKQETQVLHTHIGQLETNNKDLNKKVEDTTKRLCDSEARNAQNIQTIQSLQAQLAARSSGKKKSCIIS